MSLSDLPRIHYIIDVVCTSMHFLNPEIFQRFAMYIMYSSPAISHLNSNVFPLHSSQIPVCKHIFLVFIFRSLYPVSDFLLLLQSIISLFQYLLFQLVYFCHIRGQIRASGSTRHSIRYTGRTIFIQSYLCKFVFQPCELPTDFLKSKKILFFYFIFCLFFFLYFLHLLLLPAIFLPALSVSHTNFYQFQAYCS